MNRNNEITRIKVKTIIDRALDNIRRGKKPGIAPLMLELGYKPYSARALKIVQSETWEEEINKLADKSFLEAVKKVLGLRKRSYRPKSSGKISYKGDKLLKRVIANLTE